MAPFDLLAYDADDDKSGEELQELKRIILNKFAMRSMFYYVCFNSDCQNNNGIGVYTSQRDDVLDLVFEHGVHPDELEHEYVENDFKYTLYYNAENPYLYQQPYRPDWMERLVGMGVKVM